MCSGARSVINLFDPLFTALSLDLGACVRALYSWLGVVEIAASRDYVFYVGVGRGGGRRFLRSRGIREGGDTGGLIDEAEAQIREYLEGGRRSFELPVKLLGTEFQSKVWRTVMEIPYGSVRGYSWVARRVGCASPRPVGGALAANHLLLIVPCHRVIRSDGRLGGFSYGPSLKMRLLRHEGAEIRLNSPRSISL